MNCILPYFYVVEEELVKLPLSTNYNFPTPKSQSLYGLSLVYILFIEPLSLSQTKHSQGSEYIAQRTGVLHAGDLCSIHGT